MLNPNKDRLDYGEILAPPEDYTLDFAVGTTYSLDLNALVGACLALGLSAETDSALLNNPVFLLEALRSTGDKVAIFSECGQIHAPSNITPLFILLEKMVFSVKTKKRSGLAAYPSFHPKLWLIRYKKNSGDYLYRFVIMSRNLTFDRSWDIAYYMDGVPTNKPNKKNQPLSDFLQYLSDILQYQNDSSPENENRKHKKRMINSLIRELPNVSFKPPEKEFEDYEFMPIGVKKANREFHEVTDKPLFKKKFERILIISPFLTGGILKSFNDRHQSSAKNNILITRKVSLSKLKPSDISTFQIYTIKDAVVDGESTLPDGTSDISKQDIHAKLYIIKTNKESNLYIGSMNATSNGVNRNIEFILRLLSKNKNLIEDFTPELFGSDKYGTDNPFQIVNLQDAVTNETDDVENNLNSIIKELSRAKPNAQVLKTSETTYAICIRINEVKNIKNFKIEIRPLLSNKTADFAQEIRFDGLRMTELSEFYTVCVSSVHVSDEKQSVERVLIIPTDGLPIDREKAVVTSVVNDKVCFYRYIAFLLGDDAVLSALEGNAVTDGSSTGKRLQSYKIPALYEKMLLTAAHSPEKFKGIEYLIKAISEDGIIPEDFKKLYETFKKAVK